MTCKKPVVGITKFKYAMEMCRSEFGYKSDRVCCPSDLGIPEELEAPDGCRNTLEGCVNCWLHIFNVVEFSNDMEEE